MPHAPCSMPRDLARGSCKTAKSISRKIPMHREPRALACRLRRLSDSSLLQKFYDVLTNIILHLFSEFGIEG